MTRNTTKEKTGKITGMCPIYLILKYTENISSNQRIKIYIIFREREDTGNFTSATMKQTSQMTYLLK